MQPAPPNLVAHLTAGVGAGVCTSLALHPLDLIKVRFQVQDGVVHARRFTSVASAVRTVWAEEGVRGFYRGAGPAAWGSGASWGLYFLFYEAAKARMSGAGADGPGGAPRLNAAQHGYAAWEAGTITCLFTNPLWLVKTRMQLQTGAAPPPSGTGAPAPLAPYRSTLHALTSIVREDGPTGLYRGLVPALLLTSHGVIQFAVYEHLKGAWGLSGPHTAAAATSNTTGLLFLCGLVSKATATTATYPYQVVKARLQQRFPVSSALPPGVSGSAPPPPAREYSGVIDAAIKIARREGARGFYRGFAANLLRVAPQSALTLTLYEWLHTLATLT